VRTNASSTGYILTQAVAVQDRLHGLTLRTLHPRGAEAGGPVIQGLAVVDRRIEIGIVGAAL
jgi:hypothetical protein